MNRQGLQRSFRALASHLVDQYANAYSLFFYMPVAGGDGVQVALIPRASSCALGFARRPPPHLGARCTSHFVTHVYAHCPRALSLRWGSLHSVTIEGGGSAVSNGRRNMCEEMLFPFFFFGATGPAGLTRLSHFFYYRWLCMYVPICMCTHIYV